MIKDTKELLKIIKRKVIIWSILAVLMFWLGVAMIVMMCVILELPTWANAIMGVLTFVSGQGFVLCSIIVSLENDNVDDLENYLNKMEELDL